MEESSLCAYLCLTKRRDMFKWWLFKALCVQVSVAYQQTKRLCFSMGMKKILLSLLLIYVATVYFLGG